jgi:hypothetical protein
MKNTPLLGLLALIAPAFFYYLSLNKLVSINQSSDLSQPQTMLVKVGDECAGIADNSVANMSALVEFQKLEIQGRKINVMRRCVKDKGFIENPSWLTYATPIAKSNAINQSISEDEAIENLRREHMMIFNETSQQPIYWVHQS